MAIECSVSTASPPTDPPAQLKIDLFRHPLGKLMDESYAGGLGYQFAQGSLHDFFWEGCIQSVNCPAAEKTWTLLENAIKEINNHNASGLSFEELYRWV